MRYLALLGLLASCDATPSVEAPPVVPVVPVVAPASAPSDAPRFPTRTPGRMAASHVLVAYAQAMKAGSEVTRTREEALALARTVHAEAVAPGADFAALARKYSDDRTAGRGGDLGAFGPGKMVKAFDDAVASVEEGQVPPVVETPFGFHVIRRDPVMEVHCAQLMLGFAGAERPLPGATRTKEEARTRIDAARAELVAGKAWDAVVSAYHDGPLREDGGDLGWFARRQLMPALDGPAFDLDIGGSTEVIESPSAFHILHRLE